MLNEGNAITTSERANARRCLCVAEGNMSGNENEDEMITQSENEIGQIRSNISLERLGFW